MMIVVRQPRRATRCAGGRAKARRQAQALGTKCHPQRSNAGSLPNERGVFEKWLHRRRQDYQYRVAGLSRERNHSTVFKHGARMPRVDRQVRLHPDRSGCFDVCLAVVNEQ